MLGDWGDLAIKKVLLDRRYKYRELQLIHSMDHPNVIALKYCFFSTTNKDQLFLNLVMEFFLKIIYRVLKHYSNVYQRMPLVNMKLYMYQDGQMVDNHCDVHFSRDGCIVQDQVSGQVIAKGPKVGRLFPLQFSVPRKLSFSSIVTANKTDI
ncbi:hypothetical protein ZIOFF_016520 [Zingiber officinale]|uniref:Protein kinase domain-containing protein n=1 Tax=Zingiber officinale TaxID=94328 RepID=A0A8J5LQY9_ZINOF|nr:hypothetical protein ZIOFF_016520 [Zingiber officinale]